jgi:hypothetical protein
LVAQFQKPTHHLGAGQRATLKNTGVVQRGEVYLPLFNKLAKRIFARTTMEMSTVVRGRLNVDRLWAMNENRLKLTSMMGQKWVRRLWRLTKLAGELKEGRVKGTEGGVYVLFNTINRMVYVGETKCYMRRWREHVYNAKTGCKRLSCISMRNEGISNWVMMPVEAINNTRGPPGFSYGDAELRRMRKVRESAWAHTLRHKLINDIGAWRIQKRRKNERMRPGRNPERALIHRINRAPYERNPLHVIAAARNLPIREAAEVVTWARLPDGLRKYLESHIINRMKSEGLIRDHALTLVTLMGGAHRDKLRRMIADALGAREAPAMLGIWLNEVRLKQVPARRLSEITENSKKVFDAAFGETLGCPCPDKASHIRMGPADVEGELGAVVRCNKKTALVASKSCREAAQRNWIKSMCRGWRTEEKKILEDVLMGLLGELCRMEEIPRWLVDAKRVGVICGKGRHLTRVEIDKNNTALAVVCPRWLQVMQEETFSPEKGYTQMKLNMEGAANHLKEEYEEKGLGKVACWYSKGMVPYGRAIPKAKDLDRSRPIISCYKAGNRRMGGLAARCLSVAIKEMKKKTHGIDMYRVEEINNLIARANRSGSWRRGIAKGKITFLKFDVKEQYSNLSKERVLEALRWALTTMREGRNEAIFSLAKHKWEKYRDAFKARRGGNFFKVDPTTLWNYVCYELENPIFRVGERILKQEKGVPMGAFASAGLAVLDAIYKEWQNKSAWRRGDIIAGRFRDDLCEIHLGVLSEEEVKMRERRLNDIYGPELKIILESSNRTGCDFVGCNIGVRLDELEVKVRNPNVMWCDRMAVYTYKKTRWPEIFSASGPHIVVGCMVGELKRINTLCTSMDGVNECALAAILEWCEKGYKCRDIRAAISRSGLLDGPLLRRLVGLIQRRWVGKPTQKSWISTSRKAE